MSNDEKAKTEKPAKGAKRMVAKLVGGVGLMAAGSGGAFAMMQAGLIGNNQAHAEDNTPKLILKGQEDPYAPAPSKEAEGLKQVYGEGGSKYRTLYYSFAEDFTSNLRNSDALVQVSLAASTRRDGRVLIWLRTHELAIRSAILSTLADTPEAQIASQDGKAELQKELTGAINKVLTDHEGFGGVDAVYFRSFIIQ